MNSTNLRGIRIYYQELASQQREADFQELKFP